MPGASPTALTLRYLREQGFLAQKVERWIPTRDPEAEGRREAMLAAIAMLRRGAASDPIWQPHLISAAEEIEDAIPAAAQGSPGRRVDLFGLIDVLCLDGKPGCLGAQCCAYSSVSAHLKEIRYGVIKVPASKGVAGGSLQKCWIASRWLSCGNTLSIFGCGQADNP